MSDTKKPSSISEFKGELRDLKQVSMERLVEIADSVGFQISERVKMNQIRRFLDGARKVEAEVKRSKQFDQVKDRIVLLRPKLAYAAGRNADVKPLAELLDAAVTSAAKSEENFKKFLRLMEGIIAYHRYHGGRD
ncbi:MAG: type III-A CRISPR-associated protein Csm2 [Desulfosoma sp.]